MDVVTMRKAIWATYLSTDQKPQHVLYSTADDNSWFNYQKAKLKGDVYSHKHSLAEAVMMTIKGFYIDISNPDLLKKKKTLYQMIEFLPLFH